MQAGSREETSGTDRDAPAVGLPLSHPDTGPSHLTPWTLGKALYHQGRLGFPDWNWPRKDALEPLPIEAKCLELLELQSGAKGGDGIAGTVILEGVGLLRILVDRLITVWRGRMPIPQYTISHR